MKLWKSGEWSESVDATPGSPTPAPGKPIYEWWIGQYLESGDYLLTVYGTNPQKWTRGPEDDSLSVAYLFDPFPAERVAEATLPAWGVVAWSLPKSPVVAAIELASSPASPVDLELRGVGEDGNSIRSVSNSCRIEAKALRPRCTVYTYDDRAWSLVVRGAPGTKFRVETGRYVSGAPLSDGDFGSPSDITFKAPANGAYLVAASDVPADPDAAPLACVLRRARPNGAWDLVSRDFLQVPAKSILERTFNYNGSETTLWFDVANGSSYAITTGGQRKSWCELYRIDESGERTRLTETGKDPGCKIREVALAGRLRAQALRRPLRHRDAQDRRHQQELVRLQRPGQGLRREDRLPLSGRQPRGRRHLPHRDQPLLGQHPRLDAAPQADAGRAPADGRADRRPPAGAAAERRPGRGHLCRRPHRLHGRLGQPRGGRRRQLPAPRAHRPRKPHDHQPRDRAHHRARVASAAPAATAAAAGLQPDLRADTNALARQGGLLRLRAPGEPLAGLRGQGRRALPPDHRRSSGDELPHPHPGRAQPLLQ
ncbi:MAG: hypothetical protein QM765_41680 [Myxococcales bacterium]